MRVYRNQPALFPVDITGKGILVGSVITWGGRARASSFHGLGVVRALHLREGRDSRGAYSYWSVSVAMYRRVTTGMYGSAENFVYPYNISLLSTEMMTVVSDMSEDDVRDVVGALPADEEGDADVA